MSRLGYHGAAIEFLTLTTCLPGDRAAGRRTRMAKYYIHVWNGDVTFRDEEGVEVADVDVLLRHLRETVREIIDDEGGPSMDEQRVMEVVDSHGNIVLSLPFTTAFNRH